MAGGLAKTSVAPLERCKILFQVVRQSPYCTEYTRVSLPGTIASSDAFGCNAPDRAHERQGRGRHPACHIPVGRAPRLLQVPVAVACRSTSATRWLSERVPSIAGSKCWDTREPDEWLQGDNLHWPNGAGVMAPACCGLCRMLQCTSLHTSASGRCCSMWWRASSGGRKQSAQAHSSQQCRPALQVALGQHAQQSPGQPLHRHLGWQLGSGACQGVVTSSTGAAGQHRQVSPVLDLVAGSAAGATAVLLTYPLDLVCQCSLMAASP